MTPRRIPINLITLGFWIIPFLIGVFPGSSLMARPPSDAAPFPETGWEVLDKRTGTGERCLVCNNRVDGKDVLEIRYKGRTFHVADGMFGLFEATPGRYFTKLESRSALFDEHSIPGQRMSFGWLGFGVYVLVGMIVGAMCAYLAVKKGLTPVLWFFVGLIANVAGFVILMLIPKREDPRAPAGIPPGLRKVPVTYPPQACTRCGVANHPSAASCGGCGADLTPSVQPEIARL